MGATKEPVRYEDAAERVTVEGWASWAPGCRPDGEWGCIMSGFRESVDRPACGGMNSLKDAVGKTIVSVVEHDAYNCTVTFDDGTALAVGGFDNGLSYSDATPRAAGSPGRG